MKKYFHKIFFSLCIYNCMKDLLRVILPKYFNFQHFIMSLQLKFLYSEIHILNYSSFCYHVYHSKIQVFKVIRLENVYTSDIVIITIFLRLIYNIAPSQRQTPCVCQTTGGHAMCHDAYPASIFRQTTFKENPKSDTHNARMLSRRMRDTFCFHENSVHSVS